MRLLRLWLTVFCFALAAVSSAVMADDAPDYTQWDKAAAAAEKVVDKGSAQSAQLSDLRAQMVKWRGVFDIAKGANGDQITAVKNQIAALGPAPAADGAAEDPAIADRRKKLNESLAKLQAPGLIATEAESRADTIIGNIDKTLRDRQAHALMRLSPSVVNPANWGDGWALLGALGSAIFDETQSRFAKPQSLNYDSLRSNGPLIAFLVIVAGLLIFRGRHWMGRLTGWLLGKTAMRGRELVASVVSFGQVLLPVGGALMLTQALNLTSILGPILTAFFVQLPFAMAIVMGMWWLGARIFPGDPETPSALDFSGPRRAKGQMLSALLGLTLALENFVRFWISPRAEDLLGGGQKLSADAARALADQVETALSMLQGPLLLVAGMLLFRLGQLMRQDVSGREGGDDEAQFQLNIIRWLSDALIAIGVVGPVLGLVGYISAANATVWPTVITLGLIALVVVAQNYVAEFYAVLTHASGKDKGESLLPVLAGFALSLASLPLLALVWGARPVDLLELWNRFREGISVGGVKLSPSVFLTFVVVFAVGYTVIRLMQGALRTSILPKTTLDRGGQNAIISGFGYVGIFLSALLAISVAGIDLSSLAIVAGALSVGVGFGLQTIVQNFVSGIILLIERPISEGDWIQVGDDQGIVKAISVRSTRIEAFDKSEVVIPNATLIADRVINMTKTNRTGRVILEVGVAYGTDTRRVEGILKEIVEDHPLVMMNPPPMILFKEFGADSLNFEVRVILSDVGFGLTVKSELNHRIAERFAKEGIEIPFAQRDLWLRNPEKLAEAMAAGEHPVSGQGGEEAALQPEQGPETRISAVDPKQSLLPPDPRLLNEREEPDGDAGDGDSDGGDGPR